MTEIEDKAEEYTEKKTRGTLFSIYAIDSIYRAYKDGYEQGQKDFDTDVTKLLNSYGVTFIDTNSIGGLIALHQLILDMEKENEELKELIKNHTSYNDTIGNMLFEEENKSFQLWKKIKKEN